MKKILCLMMAAMLVAVMMKPLEADAVGSIEVDVRGGVAQITGSTYPSSNDNGGYNGGAVSYSVVLPVTTTISGLTAGSYYSGFYSFKTSLNMTVIAPVSTAYTVRVKNVTCNFDEVEPYFFAPDAVGSDGTVSSNTSLTGLCEFTMMARIHDSLLADSTNMRVIFYVEYVVTLRSSANSNNAYGTLSSVSGTASDTGYGVYLNEVVVPVGSTWLNNLLTDIQERISAVQSAIVSGASSVVNRIYTLGTDLESWFSTQWTKMQSWTDSIVTAIRGDDYDDSDVQDAVSDSEDKVAELEEAEQTLTSKQDALTEYTPPELTVTAIGGSSFVIGCLQSFYTKLGDFQYIISISLFFGILGLFVNGGKRI